MVTKAKPKPRVAAAKPSTVGICLTFPDRAEEAVKLYVSLFPNSRIVSLVRHEAGGPLGRNQVLHASFELDGRPFTAMDGGPSFSFGQGTSLVATVETQAEIDKLWTALSKGGEEQPCGWVRDRFGVSWQIVPAALGEMMSDPESGNSAAVMGALLRMGKIDLAALRRAYRQSGSSFRGRPRQGRPMNLAASVRRVDPHRPGG